MENEIFKAGVQPGGPTSHDEIKMLICYIFAGVPAEMTFSQLHEALQENSLVNYFELVQAVEELLQSGHITAAGEPEGYAVTELGRQAAREFENAVPLAVREKALRAADLLLRRKRREEEVRVTVTPLDEGFRMQLAIPEAGGALLELALFLPTQAECELVRRRFLNDPVFIYKGVTALLTGDRDVLGRIFPPQDGLF